MHFDRTAGQARSGHGQNDTLPDEMGRNTLLSPRKDAVSSPLHGGWRVSPPTSEPGHLGKSLAWTRCAPLPHILNMNNLQSKSRFHNPNPICSGNPIKTTKPAVQIRPSRSGAIGAEETRT